MTESYKHGQSHKNVRGHKKRDKDFQKSIISEILFDVKKA